MRAPSRAIAVLFAFCLPASVASSDALPDVASAPRRMEIPAEQVAGSITIIGREEIERRQLRSLVDVLRTVPGLHVVQSGGTGRQTSLFVRGTESNHTLVLLDGIEITDPSSPDGGFDYAHLLTENVERVEVLRGPQSTLYGSDALGGVINIVTRRGEAGTQASAWAEAGAHGTAQHAATLSGARGPADFSLSYTNLHTRGITAVAEDLGAHERDGYDNRTVSGRFGFEPFEGARLDTVGRFIDTEGEIDGFGADDRDSRGNTRQLFLRQEGSLELLGGRWRARSGASFTDYDRKNPNGATGRSTQDGTRMKFDLQNDFFLAPAHVLTLGAETERETYFSRSQSAFSTGRSHESARTQAVFVQHQFNDDAFSGTAGVRLDHHAEYGSELTYRVASAYTHPSTGTRLRASLGTGFKAPALDELYGATTFFTGNPGLEPEKSRSWEVGIEQPLFDGRVRVGTTYFQSHIRNLIEPTPAFDSLVNVSRARIDGFETFFELRLEQRLRVRLDHTYTSAEARDAANGVVGSGSDLLRRPAHAFSAIVEGRPIADLTLSLSADHTGHRADIDARTFARTSKGAFTIFNVAAGWTVRPGWQLFGRIENLFDRDYQDPDGFQSRGFGGYVGVKAAY